MTQTAGWGNNRDHSNQCMDTALLYLYIDCCVTYDVRHDLCYHHGVRQAPMYMIKGPHSLDLTLSCLDFHDPAPFVDLSDGG